MLELRNPRIAVPVVMFAGILWSFGPLVVRFMDNPNQVPWQYIFGRGLTIFILLNLYLYFEEGLKFWKNYLKIGVSGVCGGSGLGIAMISFIYSITNTTAAITLLCLAAMPFFTALLAFIFLKEQISLSVWISIIIATIGILLGVPKGLDIYELKEANIIRNRVTGSIVIPLGAILFGGIISILISQVFINFHDYAPLFALIISAAILLFASVMSSAPKIKITRSEVLIASAGVITLIVIIASVVIQAMPKT